MKIIFEAVSYREDGKFMDNEEDEELSADEVAKVVKEIWDDMPADYYSWHLKEIERCEKCISYNDGYCTMWDMEVELDDVVLNCDQREMKK